VLKVFDTFDREHSARLMRVLYECYERVVMIKPLTSRPANSEKYVLATGFRGLRCPRAIADLRTWLERLGEWAAAKHVHRPPVERAWRGELESAFVHQLDAANALFATRQVDVIRRTLEAIRTMYQGGCMIEDETSEGGQQTGSWVTQQERALEWRRRYGAWV
jgi:hypothetical protein